MSFSFDGFDLFIWITISLAVLLAVIVLMWITTKDEPVMVELELEEYIQLLKDRHNAGFYICQEQCEGTYHMESVRCYAECQRDFSEILDTVFEEN